MSTPPLFPYYKMFSQPYKGGEAVLTGWFLCLRDYGRGFARISQPFIVQLVCFLCLHVRLKLFGDEVKYLVVI